MCICNRIIEVIDTYNSCYVVLEELICQSVKVPELGDIGLVELVITGGCYIWWERRKLVHRERIQMLLRSRRWTSILRMLHMELQRMQQSSYDLYVSMMIVAIIIFVICINDDCCILLCINDDCCIPWSW